MWYMRLQPNLTLPPTPDPNQVRQEVRTSNVTLGSIAMNELECPRLVFITPYTPPEKRTIKTRVTEKITKAVKDRHRLIFLDPVTGTAVPCGPDGQGYVLKLPSHFLQQHGSKIRDGLIVLKLVSPNLTFTLTRNPSPNLNPDPQLELYPIPNP